MFLYEVVLGERLPWMNGVVRAQRPVRLPVVLSPDEVARLLAGLRGVTWLMASLMYGSGLRLLECVEPATCHNLRHPFFDPSGRRHAELAHRPGMSRAIARVSPPYRTMLVVLSHLLARCRWRGTPAHANASYARLVVTPETKGWDIPAVWSALRGAVQVFIQHVPSDRLGPSWPSSVRGPEA